jgi:hypothetical protein
MQEFCVRDWRIRIRRDESAPGIHRAVPHIADPSCAGSRFLGPLGAMCPCICVFPHVVFQVNPNFSDSLRSQSQGALTCHTRIHLSPPSQLRQRVVAVSAATPGQLKSTDVSTPFLTKRSEFAGSSHSRHHQVARFLVHSWRLCYRLCF